MIDGAGIGIGVELGTAGLAFTGRADEQHHILSAPRHVDAARDVSGDTGFKKVGGIFQPGLESREGIAGAGGEVLGITVQVVIQIFADERGGLAEAAAEFGIGDALGLAELKKVFSELAVCGLFAHVGDLESRGKSQRKGSASVSCGEAGAMELAKGSAWGVRSRLGLAAAGETSRMRSSRDSLLSRTSRRRSATVWKA